MQSPYQFYKRFKLENRLTDKGYSVGLKLALPLIGFLALLWFLIRVIPRPSRAAYPCQRIAFPLASSFIIWLTGIFGSLLFIRKAKQHLTGSRYVIAAVCIGVSVFCLWLTISANSSQPANAANPIPNTPIGIAKGIYPGRVVWIHDPDATDWNGPGTANGYSWQPEHTSQKFVDAMVSLAIRQLSGRDTDAQAWDAIFRHFNNRRGRGDVGYNAGEKITIKLNLTTCNVNVGYVDPVTHDKTYFLDKSDTNPQMILSILRQLVYTAGVAPNCIAVGDTLARFPNQWRDLLYSEFPQVTYFDRIGTNGRTQSTPSGIRQYWSHGLDPNSFTPDYIPSLYADAAYLINMAVLKSHGAGITLCAKNHYGSYNRTPDADGFFDLHSSLGGNNLADAQYRALVDIMGHPDMGDKTLLYMLDGLYGGQTWKGTPVLFETSPFNHDWPSSVFVSQDPVAIDSVGLDILWEEWPTAVRIGGVEDYLHEAALADNPPSGTLYDPDNNGARLQSLGVHEHWNNPVDKQYSRNLDTGNGIELCYSRLRHLPGDINSDNRIDIDDLMWLIDSWLKTGPAGQIPQDIVEDGIIDFQDFKVLSENWGSI